MKSKKFLAVAMASTLAMAQLAMPVMAGEGGTVEVDVKTKTAVIRVVVPTSLEVAVNQFEMSDNGSQIYSADFKMENKSEIPVKVDITSTAELKDSTKLLLTKAEAGSSTKAGEAWLAVAAQTAASTYGSGIGTLTEASSNVTTFTQGTGADEAKGKAAQTFYLKESGTMAYKLLNANESPTDISYAQFYELTAISLTASSEDDELEEKIKESDIYSVIVGDGATVTKTSKGGVAPTYAAGTTYYTAAISATAKSDIDTTKLYVYGDGATDTAKGVAAFRYIGKLSGGQESWTKEDIKKITIAYDISGVEASKYTAIPASNLVYGLYKAPVPTVTESSISSTNNVIHFTVPSGVSVDKVEVIKSGNQVTKLTGGGTHYTIDTSAGTITMVSNVVGGNVGNKLKITFSDNPATVKDISIVQ